MRRGVALLSMDGGGRRMEVFNGVGARLSAYQARPRHGGPWPAVVVVHGSAGLTQHYRDVTRRLARAGYVGFCVDLLSRSGGTDAVAANARGAAAAAAWRETEAWLGAHLGGPADHAESPAGRVHKRPNWRRMPKPGRLPRSVGAGPRVGPATR